MPPPQYKSLRRREDGIFLKKYFCFLNISLFMLGVDVFLIALRLKNANFRFKSDYFG
ncbi:MAG: hypothetical protein RL757_1463 [Bacteroidota bacterium]|jgi:hypothetical protein